jgi:hypothetical protein
VFFDTIMVNKVGGINTGAEAARRVVSLVTLAATGVDEDFIMSLVTSAATN